MIQGDRYNGEVHGRSVCIFQEGHLAICTCYNGLLHGKYYTFHGNGKREKFELNNCGGFELIYPS